MSSPYQVTGEPDPDDPLEVKAFLLFGRTFDPDPFMAAVERMMVRHFPACIFKYLTMGPADALHLRQEFGARPAEPFGVKAVPVFPQVAVIVHDTLPRGLVRISDCVKHPDGGGCAYAAEMWLNTDNNRSHSSYGCATGQCFGDTLYGSCGAEECEGGCENLGICDCSCHA